MDRITALVTGADHPTALGAAQALRAAGADVVGVTHRPDRAACRSRAWSEIVTPDEPSVGGTMEAVLTTAKRVRGPIFLLPTDDAMVRRVSEERERLPTNVRTVMPPHATVELLLEKTRFAGWAEESGFPVPRSVVVRSEEELAQAARSVGHPSILKPLVRTAGWHRASPVEKAIRLREPGDLESIPFDLFSAASEYVLSEWIVGGDDDVLFCLVYLDRDSKVVAAFSGRKLLQYPRLTGSTAICVDRPDAALEELTARLLGDAGCTGLASLEVKRSATDGRYLITEPTVGRPNLQSAAALVAGMNLHGIAMRDAWDRDYDDLIGPRRRCFWVVEGAILELLTTPTGVPFPIRLLVREAFARRRFRWAYFRFRDPGPFLRILLRWSRGAVRHLLRRPSRHLPEEAR